MTERRWFKPKTYGWGVSPASWEGWAITAVFVLVTVGAARLLHPYGPVAVALAVVALTAVLLVLAQATGAKGWWRTIGKG